MLKGAENYNKHEVTSNLSKYVDCDRFKIKYYAMILSLYKVLSLLLRLLVKGLDNYRLLSS